MLETETLNQYSWVMKVLDSCENDLQVGTSEKLFELYIKKWNKDMNNKHVKTLTTNFEKEKKAKLYRLRKNGGTFLSIVSQFFLF